VTRIDFYHEADDRLQVACRLVAKAVQQALRVAIYAPGPDTAQTIDAMLWAVPPTGFIPHCGAGHQLASETPVVILQDEADVGDHDDVLINLHHDWPPVFARFRRLVEIVGRDESDKQHARARFRFYKDRGYAIRAHNLAGVSTTRGRAQP
jgi:DNA polymerase-3 subunit chi